MPTTSLNLRDEIKQRAAAVAHERGISSHAFMIGAIDQATTIAEQQAAFVADASAARALSL